MLKRLGAIIGLIDIDAADVVTLVALGLIGGGLWMEHRPAALYVPGFLLLAMVLWGAYRAGRKAKG